MGKAVKYILLVGVLAVIVAYYGINSVSAQQYSGAAPVQADLAATQQNTPNTNQDSSNLSPGIPLYPPYYNMGPWMMWGNPNYNPNAGNQQQPPANNWYPNYGWGWGWCW